MTDICNDMPQIQMYAANDVRTALEMIEEQGNIDIVITDILYLQVGICEI